MVRKWPSKRRISPIARGHSIQAKRWRKAAEYQKQIASTNARLLSLRTGQITRYLKGLQAHGADPRAIEVTVKKMNEDNASQIKRIKTNLTRAFTARENARSHISAGKRRVEQDNPHIPRRGRRHRLDYY